MQLHSLRSLAPSRASYYYVRLFCEGLESGITGYSPTLLYRRGTISTTGKWRGFLVSWCWIVRRRVILFSGGTGGAYFFPPLRPPPPPPPPAPSPTTMTPPISQLSLTQQAEHIQIARRAHDYGHQALRHQGRVGGCEPWRRGIFDGGQTA